MESIGKLQAIEVTNPVTRQASDRHSLGPLPMQSDYGRYQKMATTFTAQKFPKFSMRDTAKETTAVDSETVYNKGWLK